EAVGRLLRSLEHSGLALTVEAFLPVYRAAARRFMEAAQRDGVETYNRLWVSTALQELGHDIAPDDPRIALGVDAYFSAFVDYAVPIPGTLDMLAALKGTYRLGLLSNLTYAPAALRIIDKLGMTPFFDAILVSGQLGYRKPHPMVFAALVEQLGMPQAQTAFVGDNLDADVRGAQQAGLQPIWVTHGQVQDTSAGADVPIVTNWQELARLLHRP
ncbi:MAG: HAD family hydrolase, partial [Candidatus Tectomicrobia bacterium]|nr:HAD family hydrolase [Candidatus Tectomicrobia bacterium]